MLQILDIFLRRFEVEESLSLEGRLKKVSELKRNINIP